ncbi:OPT family oligopeptide transporter [Desulfurococcus amylolyticus]|uniref:Oligopeptide transporter, OPT family n=1 Tax=Desulfurococcus amylolyticus DSM 16532 TaxID=768672 RepID=I3XS99_DESAM|nr:oligopeptide transporter, OPT family [Desulfurococcus amylolyticus]AFL66823.1 oligopeptide transporter, OPT family [Desulfurococcus amylolyticus DSM 16532]
MPYVPPEKSLPELALKYIILGVILSIVMGAANAYLGLYAGMTISASIPAAVISMALFRALGERNILGNNIVQTIASAGEALAAGVIFTMPALIILQLYTELPYWLTTIMAGLGGSLGALFTVILRRAYIVHEKLPFPEGKACAEVLIAGDKGGAHAKPLAYGGIIGAIYKFLSGIGLWPGSLEAAGSAGRIPLYFGLDLSPALLAVGFIVGLNIAILMFLGGVLTWFIFIPILAQTGWPSPDPVATAFAIWRSKARFIGVGAMLVGGIWSLIRLRSAIVKGIKSGLKAARARREGQGNIVRTEFDLPMNYVLALTALFVIPLAMLYFVILNDPLLALLMSVLMLILGFIGTAIAGYLAGTVGSSNMPVSGITIMNLLITALLLKALGFPVHEGAIATILVAGVICMSAAIAGDIMQDLYTGYMVGATPWKQQVGEIIGIFAAAFFMAPVINLLITAYGIAGTPTEKPGVTPLPAPQATLMASLTKGVFEGVVPWDMITTGVVLAIVLIIIDEILRIKGSKFRTPVMPVAVGIYLPLSLGMPIFIGGILRYIVERKVGAVKEVDYGTIGAAGLIAGEAMSGIVLAGLIVSGVSLVTPFTSDILGFILLILVMAWLFRTGLKKVTE